MKPYDEQMDPWSILMQRQISTILNYGNFILLEITNSVFALINKTYSFQS